MGVNYIQNCIVGWIMHEDHVRKLVKEEESELQARYNPKTGEKTHEEKVIIRNAEYEYEFLGASSCCLYELGETILKKHGLYFFCDDGWLTVGHSIGQSNDFSRSDLLDGSISIREIEELSDDLKQRFDIDIEPEVHFNYRVG